MHMQIYLETGRLTLRRLSTADVEHLIALDSDPEVMRYLTGGTPTPREVIEQEILPRFLRSYDEAEGFGVWAAVERATGEFLGWFSLRLATEHGQREAWLGYRLRRDAWGRGYATEGARTLIHKAFTELGVERVLATTYQDNLASRRVMEKAGMTLVRRYRLTPADLLASDTFHVASVDIWDGDDVEYAIEKADWIRQSR
jgi:RimJ/RimL family protein N-acetyltransferase